MNRYFRSTLLCLLVASGVSWGQPNYGDVTFWSISDLTYAKSAHPTLIGGRPAKIADWPANF